MKARIYMAYSLLTALLVSGCVTGYRDLQPEIYQLKAMDPSLSEDSVKITWRSGILASSGNAKYARMETKNRVSLISLHILNHHQQQIRIPEDLHFYSTDGTPVYPLTLAEALEALVEPVTDKEPAVEVDAGIWRLGRTVNDAKKVVSHLKFAEAMQEYYLQDTYVTVDSPRAGLLALPIDGRSAFTVQLK
jgi:hypothetical protein